MYGHTASLCPCQLPDIRPSSPGPLPTGAVTPECPISAAAHLSDGRVVLAYCTGLDKFEFRKVCEVEGLCKRVASEAMHRLGLCITDPEDIKILHLSQHLHSPMCGAVTVQSEAQERAGLPLLGVIFVIFQLCNL